jgi:cytochrome c oxidase cbb3-type subunit 4
MDVNDLRVAVTVASLVLFLALVAHTWSRRRSAEYDEAARLPFGAEHETNEPRGDLS